jgi:hypothetical protein
LGNWNQVYVRFDSKSRKNTTEKPYFNQVVDSKKIEPFTQNKEYSVENSESYCPSREHSVTTFVNFGQIGSNEKEQKLLD